MMHSLPQAQLAVPSQDALYAAYAEARQHPRASAAPAMMCVHFPRLSLAAHKFSIREYRNPQAGFCVVCFIICALEFLSRSPYGSHTRGHQLHREKIPLPSIYQTTEGDYRGQVLAKTLKAISVCAQKSM